MSIRKHVINSSSEEGNKPKNGAALYNGTPNTGANSQSNERRLWRLAGLASAAVSSSPPAATRSRNASRPVTSDTGTRKDNQKSSCLTAIAHLSAMMSDILASPHFARPPDEDPWASTHLITFPSDSEWQDTCYKKMLENQRMRRMKLLNEREKLIKEAEDEGQGCNFKEEGAVITMEEDPLGGVPPPALHEWNIVPTKLQRAPFHAPAAARLAKARPRGPGPVTWTIEDIANAGRLLIQPPISVDFRDEFEMRRVYTLIYDVFRYKNILSQSLADVSFFHEHSNMVSLTTLVWLLLYDLYHRSFKKRSTANAALVAALFPSAGLMVVEETLWEDRVKLAAAIARIRIKNKALQLSQLLPHHLRDDKNGQPVMESLTCWVNTKKVRSVDDVTSSVIKSLKLRLIDESTTLANDTFKLDPHCPQFIVFHPSIRNQLVQSVLVRKNKLIVQDKSFCLGSATFVKVISDLQLTGSVIQSHVNSPRTTAYLASILGQNDNIKNLLAFSAGSRKLEYENYFNDLGIKNILIFSEKMSDLPPDSNNLEEVIAVYATPPNSYSAVSDPIDLVCSRGGDLAMLEVLTETEDTPEGRNRVAHILDEQKQTLKFAMSRPQIQFVLYETHSEIDAENAQMVHRAIKEINKYAQIHHAVIQGKFKGLQPLKELQEDGVEDYLTTVTSQPSLDDKRANALKETIVPDCDLFNVSKLPDLCVNSDACLKLCDTGCYLALVQRKQVTRMDNKYMIQMAENRGVFGVDPNSPRKPKPIQRKRAEETTNQISRGKRRFKEFEIERLITPTKASMCHSKIMDNVLCEKVAAGGSETTTAKVSQSRRWWAETTRHITNLRVSVSKQKLPAHELAKSDTKHIINNISSVSSHIINNNTCSVNSIITKQQQKHEDNVRKFVKGGRVDEVVARSRRNPHNIPIYPKLRLTRHNNCDGKVPVPVAITLVTFPPTHYW